VRNIAKDLPHLFFPPWIVNGIFFLTLCPPKGWSSSLLNLAGDYPSFLKVTVYPPLFTGNELFFIHRVVSGLSTLRPLRLSAWITPPPPPLFPPPYATATRGAFLPENDGVTGTSYFSSQVEVKSPCYSLPLRRLGPVPVPVLYEISSMTELSLFPFCWPCRGDVSNPFYSEGYDYTPPAGRRFFLVALLSFPLPWCLGQAPFFFSPKNGMQSVFRTTRSFAVVFITQSRKHWLAIPGNVSHLSFPRAPPSAGRQTPFSCDFRENDANLFPLRYD